MIVFRHVAPCRNDLVRQLPVIGEQHHPGRVFVQPSHRSQVLPAQLRRHKFQNALLPRLIRRADIALGLVQQHIEILVAGDVSAVQTDSVLVRLYVLVCLSHHSAVHGRLSLLDHLPQFPAGIHGACREKLI